MQIPAAASFGSARTTTATVYYPVPIWQQAVFVLWFVVLLLPLGEFRLIRLACLAAILYIFGRYAARTLPLLVRAWPLLPFPIMAVFSSGWSAYPSQAISESILLLLTPVILVTLAARLRPEVFFRVMMLGGVIMAAYFALGFGAISGYGAVMHKQTVAYHLLLASVTSLITALNSREAPVFRILGLITCIVTFAMQTTADSATSLILGLFAITFLIGARYVWLPMSRIEHLRSVTVLTGLTAVLIGLIIVVSMPQNTIVQDFLGLFGKDTSLTGRTMIWDTAQYVAAEKPVFGHGLGSFWHPDVGQAQTLAELTHVAPGSRISFHSVFWETRVHLGWVGIGFIGLALAWSVWRTVMLLLRETSIINFGLAALMIITLSTALTESYLAGPLNLMVTSFYFGALATFKVPGEKMVFRESMADGTT